ncbi:hypothetical protein ACHQM5_028143 [Ranunculus cassubicifolius]
MTTTAPLSIASCSSCFNKINSRVAPITASRLSLPSSIQTASSIHLCSSSIHRRRIISCEVAVNFDASSSVDTESSDEDEADRVGQSKIGARVRVKAPQLKVYHIPKVPEMDIAGMEGEIKQYVAVWKGKRISANFPFKVEFFTEIQGRGRVKFLAHLREDEFEYLTQQQ